MIAVALLTAVSVFAQTPPAPAPAPSPATNQDRPVEETKKNIKILKGLPTSQLIPVMALMSNSLGVTCSYCHTDQWESDDKEEKGVARGMIAMVRDINERHFDGEQAVTCNSSHQGHPRPPAIPLLANAGWAKKPEEPSKTTGLPTIDDVLAKYVSAAGGAKAISGVKSLVEHGTVMRENGRGEPQSKPVTVTLELPAKNAIDTELKYPPEANQEIASWFARLNRIDEAKANLHVSAIVNVRGHDAYAVEVRTSQGRPDWFYFDTKDGLLLRRRHEMTTTLGVLPSEYDFDDYRAVDNVKVPFKMTWSRGDYRVTFNFDDVKTTK
jgi:hypothetical protein